MAAAASGRGHACLPDRRGRLCLARPESIMQRLCFCRPMTILGPALLVALAASTAQAEPAAEFYKGKTISLVVSSAPGGGYDALSRTVAAHLSRHIPGNPTIVV